MSEIVKVTAAGEALEKALTNSIDDQIRWAPKTFEELAEKCTAITVRAAIQSATATVYGLYLGRDIFQYAQRSDISAEVQKINFPNGPKGPKKVGRPKSNVGHVIDLLTEGENPPCKASNEWLLRSARAYEVALKNHLDLNRGVNGILSKKDQIISGLLLSESLPNPEDVFPPEPKKADKTKKEKPLKREIAKISGLLEKFFTDGAGNPRMRKLEDVSQLLRAMDKILRARAGARVTPEQKN